MDIEVPQSLTDDIINFCKELNSAAFPVFITSSPPHHLEHLEHYESFSNVENHIEAHGGGMQPGWLILEWKTYLFVAGSHAVWKNPEGQLINITPGLGISRVLFLPDPGIEQDIARLVRKNLRDSIIVDYICALADLKFDLSYNEDAETDIAIELATRSHSTSPLTMDKLFPIESNLDLLHMMLRNKMTRNSPCLCCSGKKFKHCHEKDIKKLESFSSSTSKWVVLK